MLGSQEEHPGSLKNAMEATTNLDEPTFSSQGPTGQLILLLGVKVINS
jgi:hypothetical protein